MKRLDRYIVGKFLGTFGFMLGVFCMVVVVFDLMEHLGRLLDHQAPVWDTALYYLNVCFHFASLLMGFIVFLTIIWFTSRLAQNSEIIAMLAGGMPFKRLFRPYFYAAGLLVVVALVLSHGVVPRANEQKLAFEESFVNTSVHVKDRNLYREVSPGTIVYFRSINYGRGTGYKLQLEQWQGDTLVQRMLAAKATYIPPGQCVAVGQRGHPGLQERRSPTPPFSLEARHDVDHAGGRLCRTQRSGGHHAHA